VQTFLAPINSIYALLILHNHVDFCVLKLYYLCIVLLNWYFMCGIKMCCLIVSRHCQLYVWAIETTQFVSTMRMENYVTDGTSPGLVTNVDLLLASLEEYLKQHPPVPSEVHEAVLEECQRLHCAHLYDKLQAAIANCQSAIDLVTTRQVAPHYSKCFIFVCLISALPRVAF